MFNWLFRKRRLSSEARRKLLIVAARSEEAIIETHVANVLDLLRTLQSEIDLDRGIELYLEMMGLPEPLSAVVTNRILARVDASAGSRAGSARKEPGSGRRYQNVFRDE